MQMSRIHPPYNGDIFCVERVLSHAPDPRDDHRETMRHNRRNEKYDSTIESCRQPIFPPIFEHDFLATQLHKQILNAKLALIFPRQSVLANLPLDLSSSQFFHRQLYAERPRVSLNPVSKENISQQFSTLFSVSNNFVNFYFSFLQFSVSNNLVMFYYYSFRNFLFFNFVASNPSNLNSKIEIPNLKNVNKEN